MLLSKLNTTRDEGVLGRTVDERHSFENGGDGKDGRGRNFLVRGFDGLEKVVSSIVDPWNDVGVTLGVGSPENNDTVEMVICLEATDISTNVLEMSFLVVAWDEIVGPVCLVSGNKVGV